MPCGTSLPQQPEDEAQQRGHDQSRREWKVKREALALEAEIARQAPEAQLREPGPGDADDDQYDAERDEEAAHTQARTLVLDRSRALRVASAREQRFAAFEACLR